MNKVKLVPLLLSILIIPSILIYELHYLIFKDAEYIAKDFISQLAFIPIFYFFSTIIIDKVLAKRNKIEVLRKLNMLIGVFFSEIGNKFISFLHDFEPNSEDLAAHLKITDAWTKEDFSNALQFVSSFEYKIEVQAGNIDALKDLLLEKRSFLISMMENQNLLEHDTFTDLILALFHLCEELELRDRFIGLPQNDYNHLSLDIKRVYGFLFVEWLNYTQHLKSEYPFLYSLATRSNPLKRERNVMFS